MKPYAIASPDLIGENIVSGGIRVMWGLYGWLLAKGQIVYMNRYPMEDFIGIYPEIYTGNPMNAHTVVRYILNKPGLMGVSSGGTFTQGPTSFDPNDKLYYFSKMFGEADKNHYLFLPIINLHVFKDKKVNRTKTCYFVGKGKNLGVHPSDAVLIDRKLAMNQQDLADCLNECSIMYCYDNLSAMMEIARLCGCKVKYLGEYSKLALLNYEPGLDGIQFPYDDEPKLNSSDFRDRYVDLVDLFDYKLEYFIQETQ